MAKPKSHMLTRTRQSITVNGPTMWNSLPDEIRSITSITSFKKNLKAYYLSKYDTAED